MAKIFLLIFFLQSLVMAQAISSEEIYTKVSPSIVFVEDGDGLGSGVILNSQGYILTNHHVVSSRLPVEVKVSLYKDDTVKEQIFKNVPVLKVHKDYDLALLKIDIPPGSRVVPIKKVDSEAPIRAGSTCYAIGNPEGLEKSITQGLVSFASREIEDLKYIQVSAAINPGNSGGAICNDKGELIGIATFKLRETDNIGFGIPIQKLDLKEFVTPGKQKGNKVLGATFEQQAKDAYELFLVDKESLSIDEHNFQLSAIKYLYKQAILYLPNEASPYHHLGLLHFSAREYEYAERYAEQAYRLDANDPKIMSLIISCYEALNKGKVAVPIANRFLGGKFEKVRELPVLQANAAYFLSNHYLRQNEVAKSVYFFKWGVSLSDIEIDIEKKRKRLNYTHNFSRLNSAQKAYFTGFDFKYSMQKLDEFVKLTDHDLSRVEALKKDVRNKISGSGDVLNLIPGSNIKELPEEGVSIWFPEKVNDVLFAYEGKYILAHLPKAKKIAIIDTEKTRFIKFLRFESEKFLWVTGGHHLVIYDKDSKIINTIDMKTWERSHTFRIPIKSELTNMYMRENDGSKVLLDFKSRFGAYSFKYFYPKKGQMLDVKVRGSVPSPRRYNHNNQILPNSISPIASKLKFYGHSYDIYDVDVASDMIRSKKIAISRDDGVKLSRPAPLVNNDGSFIYNNSLLYNIGTNDFVKSYKPSQDSYLSYGKLYGKNGLVVGNIENEIPYIKVYSLPDFILLDKVQSNKITKDVCIFASSYTKRIGLISGDRKKITLYNFAGVKRSQEIVQKPIPGKIYKQKVNIENATDIVLESGPDGSKYDVESNELIWDVDDKEERDREVSFVLSYKDSGGNQQYELIKVYIPN